jgi:integrase
VRNVATFLSSAFALAVDRGWIETYPVARAARPKRRRGDASPDLRYLTIAQLDAVLAEIPDNPVVRDPAPTRRGRRGTAPPPPPDVLGPVLRVLILAAAVTGLRQPELLGLHWRDVDWDSQRIRVGNAYVRGEHSAEGKPDLSTRRSVPMTDALQSELERWRGRTVFTHAGDLVFALRSLGRRSTERRSPAAFRPRAVLPAYRSSDSTTSGIPSRLSSPPLACRSGRSRNS